MNLNQNQPLSAYNCFAVLQHEICDVLNASEVLQSCDVQFIAENKLDVETQIKTALQKQGICGMVMTPTATYLGINQGNAAYQIDDFTLQIVEYTPVNRASNRENVATGLDIANYATQLLGSFNAIIGFGNLCPKGIEQSEESGLLVTKATFSTTLMSDGNYPIIYIPYVTKEELSSTLLSSIGDGKLVIQKNGEVIATFSANQKTDLTADIIADSPVWGNITGELWQQTDLNSELTSKVSHYEFDDRTTPYSPSTEADDLQLAGAKATAQFVNSSINAFAAFYITKNAEGDAFSTYAELSSATTFYNAGQPRVPTKNDYCIVLEDETKYDQTFLTAPTTRYIWQGNIYPDGQWDFQYIVNDTALTQAQLNAINSGIDANKVSQITNAMPKSGGTFTGPVTVDGKDIGTQLNKTYPYSDTLLSGVTEDGTEVQFYILIKNI